MNGMAIINPGSVGQPRDGDTRASCLLLETSTGEASIVRITYDIDAVCKKIRANMPFSDELEAILKRGH
jgi:diadenosine tetraphosphatase ApaH/serine/threonine PP2A family protein phosphatase